MMLIERPVRVRPWYRRAASCLLAEEVEEIKKEDRLRVERGEALKARRLCRVLRLRSRRVAVFERVGCKA